MKLIYHDPDIAVVVKPPNMESEHELPEKLKEILKKEVYCIHRLDLNVGGVMVYALNKKAAAALSQDVQENRLSKVYYAVCSGSFEKKEGCMTDFLLKDNQKKKAFPVRSMRKGVKEARLRYRILEEAVIDVYAVPGAASECTKPAAADECSTSAPSGNSCSLAEVFLETGRFHQIRVQFASRKHPLLGDKKYGSRIETDGIALFCHQLSFRHPSTGEDITFSAQPEEVYPWNLFHRTDAF